MIATSRMRKAVAKDDNTSGTYAHMSQYMQWYMTCTTCNLYMKAGKVYDESEMLELQCQMFKCLLNLLLMWETIVPMFLQQPRLENNSISNVQ